MPERIQMSRQRPWRADNPEAVIVARPSKWGNPYRIGEVGWNPWYPDDAATRENTVSEFEWDLMYGDGIWFERGERYLTLGDVLVELAGRDLACWCPLDQPCHADVLLDIANNSTFGVGNE